MKKILFTTVIAAIILSLQSFNSYAQDIEGIKLCDTITKQEIIQRFGEPTKYESCLGDVGEVIEDIWTNSCYFQLIDNSLIYFGTSDKGLTVLTRTVPGGIKIGDKFDEATRKAIEEQFVQKRFNHSEESGTDLYTYYHKIHDCGYLYVRVEDGIITSVGGEEKI